MHVIFYEVQAVKNMHYFSFLQAYKRSKNMDLMFCKLGKAQKHGFDVLQAKKLKKYVLIHVF